MTTDPTTAAASTVPGDPVAVKAPKKALDEATWTEIRALYELGEQRIHELAKRFDVSPSAISQNFTKNGVGKFGCKKAAIDAAADAKAAEIIAEKVSEFVLKRRERIEATNEEHYGWARMIGVSVMMTYKNAKDSAKPIGNYLQDMKSLRQAAETLKIVREERYILLKADQEIDEATLPKLQIENLTEEDILKAMDGADEEDDFDLEGLNLSDENEVVVEE